MHLLPQSLRGLTGWARATVVSAFILLASLGLCGLNYGAFALFDLPVSGGSVAGHQAQEQAGGILIMTAALESAAILVSAAAMIVSAVGLFLKVLFGRRADS